jgi:hypothetical protein
MNRGLSASSRERGAPRRRWPTTRCRSRSDPARSSGPARPSHHSVTVLDQQHPQLRHASLDVNRLFPAREAVRPHPVRTSRTRRSRRRALYQMEDKYSAADKQRPVSLEEPSTRPACSREGRRVDACGAPSLAGRQRRIGPPSSAARCSHRDEHPDGTCRRRLSCERCYDRDYCRLLLSFMTMLPPEISVDGSARPSSQSRCHRPGCRERHTKS